jgi:hypothetical protein
MTIFDLLWFRVAVSFLRHRWNEAIGAGPGDLIEQAAPGLRPI